MRFHAARNMTVSSGTPQHQTFLPTTSTPEGVIGRAFWRAGILLANLRALGKKGEAETVRLIHSTHRQLAMENWSDFELKDAIRSERTGGQSCQNGKNSTAQTAMVFAILMESIDRRLGAWRIFEAESTLAGYSPPFHRGAQLDPGGLANLPDEEIVAQAVKEVRGASQGRFGPDKLLSAGFYRSVRRLDESGRYRFLPTDQQLLAGLHLLSKKIVEMQAGEGKTIAIAFAAVMHAVLGQRVHVHTANGYLAERDYRLLAPIYRSLGLTAGVILEPMDAGERRASYNCDIVYGTVREFGFDYLRDNLVSRDRESVQTALQVAIFDEADQALIDESDTPLIIAGQPARPVRPWRRVDDAVRRLVAKQRAHCDELAAKIEQLPPGGAEFARLLSLVLLAAPFDETFRQIARENPRSYRRGQSILYPEGGDVPDTTLVADLYYVVDDERRFVTPTEKGLAVLGDLLGEFCPPAPGGQYREETSQGPSPKTSRQLQLAQQVYQSLRAHLLLEKDCDYIATEDSVVILDPHTGRTKPDNLYRHGLQAALEAKEGVTVNPECESLAQVSVQGFANLYRSISGITGTAQAAGEEFQRRYSTKVISIPTARYSRRVELPSRIYDSERQKIAAIVEDVRRCQQFGRPVLVGVQSIDFSRSIGRALTQAGIEHRLLNAVTSEEEADIVRAAGRVGAVTVATDLAGRGTDIVLDPDLDQVIVERWLNWIHEEAQTKPSALRVICHSSGEAEILDQALANRQEFSVARQRRRGRFYFSITCSERNLYPAEGEYEADVREFGLGLHVISAEFSRFPRVVTQLKGRSGRQGMFGSARQLLSWEDRWLLPLVHRKPELGQPGQGVGNDTAFHQGRATDRYISRRQQDAEAGAAAARSMAADFLAVGDAQASAYYGMRRMVTSCADLSGYLQSANRDCATRLVNRHFPNLDAKDYEARFRSLAEEACRLFGIKIFPLAGESLDRLAELVETELQAKLTEVRLRIGEEALQNLARNVMLECGDQHWQNHVADLQLAVFNSATGGYYHKASVASHILHAREMWDEFQERLQDSSLSWLLTFPLQLLVEEAREMAMLKTNREELLTLKRQALLEECASIMVEENMVEENMVKENMVEENFGSHGARLLSSQI